MPQEDGKCQPKRHVPVPQKYDSDVYKNVLSSIKRRISCQRNTFGTQVWRILTSRAPFLIMVTNTLCYTLVIVPLIMSFNQLLRQMRKFVDCGPILLFDRLLCKLLEKSFVIIYKVKLICFLLRLS